jgi:putative transcriptional regulator
MASFEGHFLLASRRLLDPNFVHTVVLLIEHNDTGALGVVLNRPTSKTVQELWRQVGNSPCECLEPVHLGGPVSGPVMALHTLHDVAETEIVPGVYFAAKKPNLDDLVCRSGDHRCKLFVGHAGWGPGQLESEIEQGAWHTAPATLEDVFDDADDLWQRLVEHFEGVSLPAMLGIKHIPPDPSVN